MPSEYIYHVSAWWTSGRTGLAKCGSAPNLIHFSEPPEFGGLEGRWTPEQLLLCSLASCFTTTFQDVARSSGFEYTDLEVEVEGSVRRSKGACNFSGITIRPTLIVSTEQDMEAGKELLRKTKAVCLISRVITVPQTLEARAETCKMPAEAWAEQSLVKLGV